MRRERTEKYLLVNDAAETQRLRLQAKLWEAEATRFLAALDIREGAKALDLGCGAMGVLAPLALLVGKGGSVVGFDADATLLDSAREFIAEAGLANVSLVEGDAFQTGLPDGHFDVVHARFLFAPLGRPRELLAEMLRVLRPGGIIAIQEPDASCWNVAPAHPSWSALKATVLAAFRAGGGNFDAGRETFGLLASAGLEAVSQRNAVLAVEGRHPYKRLPLQFAASLRARIVGGGLLDEETLDALLSDVATIADDPLSVVTTFIVTQVSGRKAA